MNFWVKALLGLAVALPLGGYLVGSLAASADDPSPRQTIVIRDSGASTGPDEGPSPGKARRGDDARRDDDAGPDDDGPGDDDGDDGLQTVMPEPDDLDDDSGDSGDSGDSDDSGDNDSSGPGPNSGPGGGDTDERDEDDDDRDDRDDD